MRIEVLTKKRFKEASYVFANAFEHDVVILRMIPISSRNRVEKIARYYRWSISITGYQNIDVVIDDNDSVIGVAMWEPPKHKSHLIRAIKPFLALLITMGGRWWSELNAYSQASSGTYPDKPHWHLSEIAVLSKVQGQGVGGFLIKHKLKMIDECQDMVSLEATSEASRKLYSRYGFTDVKRLSTPAEGVVVMKRDPQ